MTHAIVRDTAASWEDYCRLAAELGDESVRGHESARQRLARAARLLNRSILLPAASNRS